jgi:DNA-binding transcriptional ArsR family regulator
MCPATARAVMNRCLNVLRSTGRRPAARQRAVLILRDVLGYHAREVAEMLDVTVGAANSILKRARAGLQRRLPDGGSSPAPAAGSTAERTLVAKITRAYDSGHIEALVELLTTCAIPPTAPATGSVSTSSPSAATGSARSSTSTAASSRRSGCRPRPGRPFLTRNAISRPAVSRHLRVLRQCGLVVDEARGRERVYRLDVAPLAELDTWLSQFRSGWEARLDALETEVYRTRRDRRTSTRPAPTSEERTA